MRDKRLAVFAALLAGALVTVARFAASEPIEAAVADWPFYGGDAGGTRYSRLGEINRSNVARLRVAWEYRTGDVSDGSSGRPKSAFETTPVVAHGTMYFTTPFNRVIALDPENGKEKWSFDPKIDLRAPYSEGLINRGVALWNDTERKDETCSRRVFLATIDARLIALDAATGRPCDGFGERGQVDLTRGIPNITRRGEYEETSAPAIAGDLVIVGSSIADNDRVKSPSGACARSTCAPVRCAGCGILSSTTLHPPARATSGPPSRSMPSAGSCSCRPAAQAPIIMASRGAATTNGQTRSSHYGQVRANLFGDSNSYTTTFGITTSRPNRLSSRYGATVRKCPPSFRAANKATCLCSIG
jgi:hypothetical protein